MTYDTNSLKELSETEDSTETVTATEPQAETPAEPSTDGATDAATEADTPTTDDAKTDDTAAADSDNHIFKSVSVKNEGGKYVFSAVLNRIGGEVQGYSMLRLQMITGTASERIGSGKYRSEIDRLVKAVM